MSGISILRQGKTLCAQSGEGRVELRYKGEYLPGDVIEFESDFEYAILSVDQTILPARVYLPHRRYVYPLPLDGDNPLVYVPGAFRQSPHILSIREDTGRVYRNLALNPADSRAETLGFPHITANVETRNESVFAATLSTAFAPPTVTASGRMKAGASARGRTHKSRSNSDALCALIPWRSTCARTFRTTHGGFRARSFSPTGLRKPSRFKSSKARKGLSWANTPSPGCAWSG